MEINEYLRSQILFSSKTFGSGYRTGGVVKHIQKELQEILEDPGNSATEWIDVIILGCDGYWRHGGKDLDRDLNLKAQINRDRQWPNYQGEDDPIEHIGGSSHHISQLCEQIRNLQGIVVEKQKEIDELRGHNLLRDIAPRPHEK